MAEGGQRSQVYADYYTVIPQINYSYSTMLEYYRIYFKQRLDGKENKRLMNELQSNMVFLYDLLKHYKAIASSSDKEKITFGTDEILLKDAFFMFDMMTNKSLRMNFKALTIMKDALVKAYHLLGLSDIEKVKKSFLGETQEWNPRK